MKLLAANLFEAQVHPKQEECDVLRESTREMSGEEFPGAAVRLFRGSMVCRDGLLFCARIVVVVLRAGEDHRLQRAARRFGAPRE